MKKRKKNVFFRQRTWIRLIKSFFPFIFVTTCFLFGWISSPLKNQLNFGFGAPIAGQISVTVWLTTTDFCWKRLRFSFDCWSKYGETNRKKNLSNKKKNETIDFTLNWDVEDSRCWTCDIRCDTTINSFVFLLNILKKKLFVEHRRFDQLMIFVPVDRWFRCSWRWTN